MSTRIRKPFTGYTMAIILVAFFGFVAAVNFTMARYASSTFGGVVVENSYVASQEFNGWLDNAEKQKALGWDVTSVLRGDQRVEIRTGNVPAGAQLTAYARHPLGRAPDRELTMVAGESGVFLSNEVLPEGRWTVRLQIDAGADTWRGEDALR